jgi:UDP:flavonoid glycosyltransferase YjiC (YdhE family)
MVEEWGAGIALPNDPDSAQVRVAVEKMLTTPSYASEAKRLSANFEGLDGAQLAADSLEGLLESS